MGDEIRLEGLGLASGVLEKLITLSAEGVDGVLSVGAPGIAGIVQKGAGRTGKVAKALAVSLGEDGKLCVTVRLHVRYGRPLHELAADVQSAVADGLRSHVGHDVGSVDVYIDGIEFGE